MAAKLIERSPEILARLSEETKNDEAAMRQLDREAEALLAFMTNYKADEDIWDKDIDESIEYWEKARAAILESRGIKPTAVVPLSYFNVTSLFFKPATDQTAQIFEEINNDFNTYRAAYIILQIVLDYQNGIDTKAEGVESGAMAVIRIPESEFSKRVYKETAHRTKEEYNDIIRALKKLSGKPIQLNAKFKEVDNKGKKKESEAETEKEGKKKKWKLFDFDIECPIWSISKVGKDIYIYFCKYIFWGVDSKALAFMTEQIRGAGHYLPRNVIAEAPKVVTTEKFIKAEKSEAYSRFKSMVVKTTHKNEADILRDIFGYGDEVSKQLKYKGRKKIKQWFEELQDSGEIAYYKYNSRTKVFSWGKRQPTLFDDTFLKLVEGMLNCYKDCKNSTKKSQSSILEIMKSEPPRKL